MLRQRWGTGVKKEVLEEARIKWALLRSIWHFIRRKHQCFSWTWHKMKALRRNPSRFRNSPPSPSNRTNGSLMPAIRCSQTNGYSSRWEIHKASAGNHCRLEHVYGRMNHALSSVYSNRWAFPSKQSSREKAEDISCQALIMKLMFVRRCSP